MLPWFRSGNWLGNTAENCVCLQTLYFIVLGWEGVVAACMEMKSSITIHRWFANGNSRVFWVWYLGRVKARGASRIRSRGAVRVLATGSSGLRRCGVAV